jgi:hypothetical protein
MALHTPARWSDVSAPVSVFSRAATDARPAVHALPRGQHAFAAPGGTGVIVGGVAWIPLVDHVLAATVGEDPAVTRQGAAVAISGLGKCVLAEPRAWSVERARHVRRGDGVSLHREGPGWASADLSLTDGARRASDTTPFPEGHGVVWSDSGWIYRQVVGGRPVAVGAIGKGEALIAGPHGAVAVRGEHGVERAAAPGHSVGPLSHSLDPHGPVRFSADGARIAGLHDGDAVVLDTRDGSLRVREPGAIVLDPDTLLAPGDDAALAWMSCAPVWDDEHIGGPEGAIWSFADHRRTTGPLLGPGPTAATRAGWATSDGNRRVRWLDPRTGASLGSTRMPEGHWVMARALGDAAYFGSADHRWVRVTNHGAVEHVHDLPAAPKCLPAPPLWASLGVESCLTRHGRLWMWSNAGLLLSTG